MAEKVGWWAVGVTVVGSLAALCLFGFTFLNARVDASENLYRTGITEVRREQYTAIKDLKDEIIHRFDMLDKKFDTTGYRYAGQAR